MAERREQETLEEEELSEEPAEDIKNPETPKISRKLLLIGLLLLCAGFIGIVGLRLGFIQNLLGDSDPYPGIGHVEPSGHIVSSIPFVIGLVTVVFWGIKNDPLYYEAEKAEKEEEAMEEESEEEPEDMELPEPAVAEEYTEQVAETEEIASPEEQEPAAAEQAPEPAEPSEPKQDHIPEDLREELLDSFTEIEQELSKMQSTAASKPKPQVLKASKPAPPEDTQAEKKRIDRCNKMLSFANMAENDKEQLRVLIDTGISIHDFTENVKEAVEKQKKKKAEESRAADPSAALREDDLVAELTSLGDELGNDIDEAPLEDIDLSSAEKKKKEK